jgi:two-component system nitrogen regulation response regulator NtrX
VHVRVPRLAERPEDIAPLAERFLRRVTGDSQATVPADLLRLLGAYEWPGNARELRNVIERFATFQQADPTLLFGGPGEDVENARIDLGALSRMPYGEAKRVLLREYHRIIVPAIVERSGSVAKAAESLGLSRASLYRLLQETRSDEEDGAG